MGIVQCPECHIPVSDRAPACPECGCPLDGVVAERGCRFCTGLQLVAALAAIAGIVLLVAGKLIGFALLGGGIVTFVAACVLSRWHSG